MKRLFDCLFACFLLVVLFPFWLCIILILRFTGDGEVFYRQPRVGKGEKMFNVWKFSTMRDMPGVTDCDVTLRNDPRVTPLGKVLRKTKLNELPQLINILRGEMSFVGPRPITVKNFSYYTEDVRACIREMTPGITGVGSIVFRDEEAFFKDSEQSQEQIYRNRIAPLKGRLEIWYRERMSLGLDLVLIVLTAVVVVCPDSSLVYRLFPSLPRPEDETTAGEHVVCHSSS